MVESSNATGELYADWFILIVGVAALVYFNRHRWLPLLPLFRYVEEHSSDQGKKPEIKLSKDIVKKYTDTDVAEDDIISIAQAYQEGQSRTSIQKQVRVPYYMVKAVCDTVDMITSSTSAT